MKDKYRLAFQSALGEWVNCLVAKDRKSALKILSSAKANQFGNLSILPLKEMSHLIEQKKLPPKGKGIIGVADELSGIEADYKKLAQLLVGNLLIVDDLEIEINSHYRGYLKKQKADILAFKRDENLTIPENLDYDQFSSLSNEVKSKFKHIRPKTMGQALRIDGITPAAVYILLSHVKRKSIKHIA